jgi:hypothetical protein
VHQLVCFIEETNSFTGVAMTLARKLLMETLVGHFAWLETTHPNKAHSPLARKARQHAKTTLKKCNSPVRRLAA